MWHEQVPRVRAPATRPLRERRRGWVGLRLHSGLSQCARRAGEGRVRGIGGIGVVLDVLWTARTYCGAKITDAQLAGRAAANRPTARAVQPTDAVFPTDAEARVPEQIADARAAPEPRDFRAAGGSTGRYF